MRKEVAHSDDVPDVDDVDLEYRWHSPYHSADCSNREAAEEITAPMWRLSGQYPLTQKSTCPAAKQERRERLAREPHCCGPLTLMVLI
jgi:hypothetical protein